MRILITGGAGFIGSHIAELFQGRAEVRVLDNLRSGYIRNLSELKVEFIRGDVRDRVTVARAVEGVDYVFHLAAMISVPESMNKPIECVDINVNGTLTVLEEAAKAGVKKLCFSSSAAIYGDNPEMPKHEGMLPEPKSPYAITKLDGEYYCNMFRAEGRLNTVSLRYFNVFGPRQDPGSAYAAAVPIFAHRAIHGEKMIIYGDGEQSRDFVCVRDVARANAFMAQNDLGGVYNVACGHSLSINELVNKIRFLTDSQSEVEHQPERPGDIRHSLAAVEKLAATGFKPQCGFSGALAETINFYK